MLNRLRPYRRLVLTLVVMGIISAVGNGLTPLLVGLFVDVLIDPTAVSETFSKFELAFLILGVWLALQLVITMIDWRIAINQDNLGVSIYSDYLVNGFSHLLELPLSFHKTKKIGYVGEKINRTATDTERIISNVAIDLGPQFLTVIIALGVAFFLQPFLALWLMIAVLFYVFIMIFSVRPLASMQESFFRKISNSYGDAFDVIFNTQAIKESTNENREKKKLDRNFNKKSKRAWVKLNTIWLNLSFYQRFLVIFVQLAIFLMSLWFITEGRMTVGQLVAFNAYASMMFGPFVRLGQMWQNLQTGLVNLVETEKILSLPKEKYRPTGVKDLSLEKEILFDRVDFHYERSKPVLRGISFKVKAGQTVALVGESGVGKTTLAEMVSGYHFPRRGRILFDGVNIKKLDLSQLRRKVAVVPQEVVLFNDTIKNNIKYGNMAATDQEVVNAAKEAHAYEFIEKFPKKWDQLVGERGVKLSTGQKQRVAIARAILRSPEILILDEPTSALDAYSEKTIQESLDKLMAGRTTFIIAHRLSTVRRADQIIVLKKGEIVEQGSHKELIQSQGGVYKKLYDLQSGLE